jgi:4-amino-4-deoxy-L-arabinose transferase-like glycosyltransferase
MSLNQSREPGIGVTAPTWSHSVRAVGFGRVWSRTGLTLGVIIALAFGLRVGAYVASPRPVEGAGLAAAQAEMARNIVDHGKWFVMNPKATKLLTSRQTELNRLVDPKELDLAQLDRSTRAEPEIDQMPGLALVLAALWWPTGNETYAPLQWLQLLVDTIMVFLIYWIGIRLTRNVHVSLLAALLYAIWPAAIVMDRRPVLDTWAIFFTIGCVAAFLWARERPSSRWRLITLGVLTGVGMYFRPFVLLLPIALAVVATPGGGWKRRLLWIATPTAVALLVLAPWTVRNYYEFHRFIPTRTGLGQAVFQGAGLAHGDENSAKYVRGHAKDATYGSPKYDGVLFGAAVRDIADHPGPYVRKVVHRARFLLPCLLVILVWRRWRINALVPLAAAMATIVPYLLIGDDTRFYLPAAFAYCILVAMAAVQIGMLFRGTVSRVPSRARSQGL